MLWASSQVFFMLPGLGLFYAGLSEKTHTISILMIIMLSGALINIQWLIFGFSLVFSDSGTPFIGDSQHFGLQGVYSEPQQIAPGVPTLALCL